MINMEENKFNEMDNLIYKLQGVFENSSDLIYREISIGNKKNIKF